MSEKGKGEEFYCPCREVDSDHFISNEELEWLLKNQDNYEFCQDDYLRVYNCIHCNNCGTAEDRFILKKKFLDDGGKIDGLEDTINALRKDGTPFTLNTSRVKIPEGLPPESDTLLYLGCFTSVKTPKYAQNIIKYLLKKKVEFTILEKEICCGYPILCNGAIDDYYDLVKINKKIFKEKGYKNIITVCPSCYMVFKKEYCDLNLNVRYFTEYLKPSKQKKTGKLIIQHACPLRNGEIPGIVQQLEHLYEESGYEILSNVPNKCAGGGVGHQLRIDIIEAIAMARMNDFKEKSKFFEPLEDDLNYITTYCPDAYWILKVFGRKQKIPFHLKDLCELLL